MEHWQGVAWIRSFFYMPERHTSLIPEALLLITALLLIGLFRLLPFKGKFAGGSLDYIKQTFVPRAPVQSFRKYFPFLAGVSIIVTAACLSYASWPEPGVHDEFAYILGAETFTKGRLINPPHPHWHHFESFHILQRPSYMSKFPPAQALFLAIGQAGFGEPIVGVWLSVALAVMSIYWMLSKYFTFPWAAAGTLLAATKLTFSYWSQSYWGGAVAVIGGALLYGAIRNVGRNLRRLDVFILVIGLAILANSRPYEGFVLALPAAAYLFWQTFTARREPFFWTNLRKLILLGGVLISLVAAWMLYYNYRASGNPLEFPYMVHEKTYGIEPPLLWQTPNPVPTYSHPDLAKFHEQESSLVDYIDRTSSLSGFFYKVGLLFNSINQFYFGFALLPVLLMGIPVVRRRYPFLALGALLGTIGLWFDTTFFPHYSSGLTALYFVFVTAGLQVLWRVGGFSRAAVVAMVLVAVLSTPSFYVYEHHIKDDINLYQYTGKARASYEEKLRRLGGRHLVFVRSSPETTRAADWVYNSADIDGADIVWARDFSGERNTDLINYYADGRRLWLISINAFGSASLAPYPLVGTPPLSSRGAMCLSANEFAEPDSIQAGETQCSM